MSKYTIIYDDSGESEYYGEFNWFIADDVGNVMHDLSFETEKEAQDYLTQLEEA